MHGSDRCGSYRPCSESSRARHGEFFCTHTQLEDIIVVSWYRERVNRKTNRLPREPNQKAIAILHSRLLTLASTISGAGSRLLLVDAIPITCQPDINSRHFILRLVRIQIPWRKNVSGFSPASGLPSGSWQKKSVPEGTLCNGSEGMGSDADLSQEISSRSRRPCRRRHRRGSLPSSRADRPRCTRW